MFKIRLFSIISISFCLLFQFSGCTTTSFKAPPVRSQILSKEKGTSSEIANLKTADQLSQSPDFPDLNLLTSPNSLEDFTQYACILHKISGKGILQTDFPVIINSEVKKFIHYFQNEKGFTRKSLFRAGAYLPFMKSIFRENNLPEDLVFLAFIESGFNSYAYSRAGASGPWQFMKATAKDYGLQVDLWIDERRDPEKSTRAAVKYLKVLYSIFGDWYLAITAYNAGEQKVANAIKRYKTTNYWILQKKRYLKLESRNFVPKLLAAILIGKHPEEYGFTELKFQDPVPLTSVHIPNPTDLKFIAKMAGISLAELKRHNPALRKWCTPPRKNGYWIKIPASNKKLFAQNFARNKKKFLTSRTFHKHRIRRGETLYEIARHYNTKVVHIQKMNGIRNPRLIHPGKILLIPIPPFTSS